jgi:hypothetical protein
MLCFLQVMDILTTQTFMAKGGTEGNPLMAWVIGHGWEYAWGAKFLVMCMIPLVAVHRRKALIFLLYIHVGVIINNILLIKHLTTHG